MVSFVDKLKRMGLLALLLGVIALSLSACGGDSPTATPAPLPTNTVATGGTGGTGSTGSEQVVNITLNEFSITPAAVTVSPGKVKFVVTNAGALSHNFTITNDTGVLAATPTFGSSDGAQTFELDLTAGTYGTLCTVPGHAEHGQKGTITVK